MRQWLSSCAMSCRWYNEVCGGASINKVSVSLLWYCATAAWKISLSFPPRRILPSQRSLRTRTLRTRLKVVEEGLASSRMVLPVKLASMMLFAPLRRRRTLSLRSHVSEPNVSREQMAATYKRVLIFTFKSSECRMLRSCPHRVCAFAILDAMS